VKNRSGQHGIFRNHAFHPQPAFQNRDTRWKKAAQTPSHAFRLARWLIVILSLVLVRTASAGEVYYWSTFAGSPGGTASATGLARLRASTRQTP